MNEKEKLEFYIAMCKCCLVADELKSCPTCNFRVGLEQRKEAWKAIEESSKNSPKSVS